MCVAAPGRVIEIEGKNITVDYNGNKVQAHGGLIPVEIGDYVLVHAGLIIQVLSQTEAEEMIALFAELEEFNHD